MVYRMRDVRYWHWNANKGYFEIPTGETGASSDRASWENILNKNCWYGTIFRDVKTSIYSFYDTFSADRTKIIGPGPNYKTHEVKTHRNLDKTRDDENFTSVARIFMVNVFSFFCYFYCHFTDCLLLILWFCGRRNLRDKIDGGCPSRISVTAILAFFSWEGSVKSLLFCASEANVLHWKPVRKGANFVTHLGVCTTLVWANVTLPTSY